MKTLDALQRDIDTAADLQSIVRTMKVLAAVSIRQYEQALESLAEYGRAVELGLQVVLRDHQEPAAGAAEKNLAQTGAIVFGSDHGLCGRYNESIAAFALQALDSAGHGGQQRRMLAVGARVDVALRARGKEVEECFFVPGSVAGINALVQKMLLQIDSWQNEGVGRVLLFHNAQQRKTAYSAQATILLPLDLAGFGRAQTKPWPSRSLPMFTMDSGKLLGSLVRQHLFITLFRACAASLAAEHASRLLSMQAAEKNIKERTEALTAAFRQQRQNQITEELLEVVSGFVALESG